MLHKKVLSRVKSLGLDQSLQQSSKQQKRSSKSKDEASSKMKTTPRAWQYTRPARHRGSSPPARRRLPAHAHIRLPRHPPRRLYPPLSQFPRPHDFRAGGFHEALEQPHVRPPRRAAISHRSCTRLRRWTRRCTTSTTRPTTWSIGFTSGLSQRAMAFTALVLRLYGKERDIVRRSTPRRAGTNQSPSICRRKR